MSTPLDPAARAFIDAVVDAAPELSEEQVNTLRPVLSQPAEQPAEERLKPAA